MKKGDKIYLTDDKTVYVEYISRSSYKLVIDGFRSYTIRRTSSDFRNKEVLLLAAAEQIKIILDEVNTTWSRLHDAINKVYER